MTSCTCGAGVLAHRLAVNEIQHVQVWVFRATIGWNEGVDGVVDPAVKVGLVTAAGADVDR